MGASKRSSSLAKTITFNVMIKRLIECLLVLFGRKKPIQPPVPVIFDPIIAGYKLKTSWDWQKNLFYWGELDWREPWSFPDNTRKGNTIWKKECVEQKFDGLHLIAYRKGNNNECGMISSHRCMELQYGFIEVSCKMPPNGFLYFPAIWMYNKLGWQPEIDIVELMGPDSKSAAMTHHWVGPDGNDVSEGYTKHFDFDLSLDFHKYAVEWTKTKLTWYIDRIAYYSTENNIPDVPLFLICNIQSGGIEGAFNHLFAKHEVPTSMIVNEIKIWTK